MGRKMHVAELDVPSEGLNEWYEFLEAAEKAGVSVRFKEFTAPGLPAFVIGHPDRAVLERFLEDQGCGESWPEEIEEIKEVMD